MIGAEAKKGDQMNDEQRRIAGDEIAPAIPTEQAAAWTLRIALDGLRRRHQQAFARAQRAEAESDAARLDMHACEAKMRDLTAALRMLSETKGEHDG